MITPLETDFLLVGQGLAGTLLAHFLEQEGRSVHLIDPGYERAASRVAAGIINPVTGRRFVRSWRIGELLPAARQTYAELEALLGRPLFRERGLVRSIFSVQEENDWLSRSGDPAYAPFLADDVDLGAYAGRIEPARGYGEIRQAAQVDLRGLVEGYRRYLLDRDRLREEVFEYDKLELDSQGAAYKYFRARQVVFCEGRWARENPFFGDLPFQGDKGDVLLVRFPEAKFEKMLKHKVFIVPLPDGTCWVGATYVHQFTDDAPTDAGREEMLRRLRATVRTPFEVLDHRTAVRPTVRDRRPFLGRHPQYPQLAVFNGLGTKGASLGPFFARQMALFLTGQGEVDEEVDIGRFGPPVPP